MEDSRVCPICETANPPDATHCEVCGESLVPQDDAGDINDQLADGGDVVGFAVEDSDAGGDVVGFAVEESDSAADEDIEFAAGASDATSDGMPAFDDDEEAPELEDEADADVTDEEMVMAAPADETATMDSYAEEDDEAAEDFDEEIPEEVEPSFADETGEMESSAEEAADESGAEEDAEFEEAEFVADADEEFGDEEPADEEFAGDDTGAEFDADESEFGSDVDEVAAAAAEGESEGEEPEFLYSPHDGTAYPRGSAEYEEGFGPNGEELVATPPDAAFDALEAEVGGEVSGASMDDNELAAAAAPSAAVSAEFKAAFVAKPKERPTMAPLPQPGAYVDPAVLTVYQNRQPVMRLAIDMDEVLIGRRDPVADAYPDLDLSELDPEAHISRKHAYIYRQNKNYTLYAVSNAGTQLNSDLLDLGDRRKLSDGDVIVLAGKIAMKFELPNA